MMNQHNQRKEQKQAAIKWNVSICTPDYTRGFNPMEEKEV
jgi:hypothetical protein